MAVVTISQRKDREANRRAESARKVKERLREFVKKTGNRGKFIVFGSVAAGAVRFTSDFDVIVDFPDEIDSDAVRAVEDACSEAGIPADVHSVSTSDPDFVAKILSRPVEVIA